MCVWESVKKSEKTFLVTITLGSAVNKHKPNICQEGRNSIYGMKYITKLQKQNVWWCILLSVFNYCVIN